MTEATYPAPAPATILTRWEYSFHHITVAPGGWKDSKTYRDDIPNLLAQSGAQGWELVSMTQGEAGRMTTMNFVFKRAVA